MSAGEVTLEVLVLVWVTWIASTAVVAVRALRDEGVGRKDLRVPLIVSAAVSCALIICSMVFAFRVDSSGVMELVRGAQSPDFWKGVAGKALILPFYHLVELVPYDLIVATRLFHLPATLLALALVSTVFCLRGPGGSTEQGSTLDGSCRRRTLIMLTLALLLTPSFSLGLLGAFNFWFVPMLIAGILLASERLDKRGSFAARISLVSGVVLLGLSRPELLVAGLVLAALLVVRAARRRDGLLGVMSVVLFLALLAAAPSVLAYLFERMRHQPLLMGADVVGDAPAWHLPLVGVRRIVTSLPLNIAALAVAYHLFGVLAARRLFSIARERRASWTELTALALIVVEFLAIGIHEEGFIRWAKYGQILVVPVSYLALKVHQTLAPSKARRWCWGSVVSASVVCAAGLALQVSGIERAGLAVERTVTARRSDMELLWRDTPRLASELCTTDDAGARPRVLVVGLDERGEGSEADEGDEIFSERVRGGHESERWPIEQLLELRGCPAASRYLAASVDLGAQLLGTDSRPGALCTPFNSEVDPRDPALPRYALVTFYRPERRREVLAAVQRPGPCRVRVVRELTDAVLLARDEPQR